MVAILGKGDLFGTDINVHIQGGHMRGAGGGGGGVGVEGGGVGGSAVKRGMMAGSVFSHGGTVDLVVVKSRYEE